MLPQRRTIGSSNKLKIGIFGANCSSGRTVTKAPERWTGSWEGCLTVARIADEAGLDFMLPIARWRGFGGDTDYQGATLETMTWAAAILACTTQITVFATVHAPLVHPIIAAKQIVTADTIGKGRCGLNIVCGWNEDEFDMFGVTKREREQGYAFAQSWLDAMLRLWGPEDGFDLETEFHKFKDARAKPKPYGQTQPILMNAGQSPAGRAFAIRNCDAFFTVAHRDNFENSAATVKLVKVEAESRGRDIDVFTVGAVTCRPTRAQAEDYFRYSNIDNADWTAVDAILEKRGITADNTPPEKFETARHGTAGGLGQIQLVGSPDDIAGWLASFSRAGLSGIGISFVNYAEELPYFCAEVLPRLERAGLRVSM